MAVRAEFNGSIGSAFAAGAPLPRPLVPGLDGAAVVPAILRGRDGRRHEVKGVLGEREGVVAERSVSSVPGTRLDVTCEPRHAALGDSRSSKGGAMAKKARAFEPRGFLAGIASGKTTRQYDSNQTVFSQGDAADAVFFIESGKVKLSVVSLRGKEAVLGILEPGSFFGEGCLAGQTLRMATAAAMHTSSIIRVDRKAILDLIHGEPEFAELFIRYLLSRNVRIEEDLVDQLFNSAEKRLARALLLLAHFGKDPRPEAVVPKMSHETLAAMVGTTRSRVSFFMNRFRKLGFIEYDAGLAGLTVHSALLTVVLRD